MGIRGLMKLIESRLSHCGEEYYTVLKRGSIFCVDGNALAFSMVEGDRVDHGGDYASIHRKTIEFVSKVRASGLDLCVFWDGHQKSKMKDLTSQKRELDRKTSRERLLSAVLDKASSHPSCQKQFPVPPLFAIQVRATLLRQNVRQIQLHGEADPCIAFQVCEINNTSNCKAYVRTEFQYIRCNNNKHILFTGIVCKQKFLAL